MVTSVRKRYGYAAPPLTVSLLLTERCNLHCHMCPHGEGTVASPGALSNPDMLSVDLADRLFRDLEPFGTEIGLMGGEPLLHKDCMEIIRLSRKRNLKTHLVTNGTLLKRDAAALLETGVNVINLSLDGPEAIHDQVRGQKKSYKLAIDGVRTLKEASERSGLPLPEFHVFCVITGENHSHLLEFLEELIPYHPSVVQLNHLRFFTPRDVEEHRRAFQSLFGEHNDDPAGYQKDLSQVGVDVVVLKQQLNAIRCRDWPFNLVLNPGYPDEELDNYYYQSLYERSVLRTCHAIWTFACVGPSGEVYPCYKYICGNLKEQSFLSIWNGPRWRRFRREIDKVERLPGCHRCCF